MPRIKVLARFTSVQDTGRVYWYYGASELPSFEWPDFNQFERRATALDKCEACRLYEMWLAVPGNHTYSLEFIPVE